MHGCGQSRKANDWENEGYFTQNADIYGLLFLIFKCISLLLQFYNNDNNNNNIEKVGCFTKYFCMLGVFTCEEKF